MNKKTIKQYKGNNKKVVMPKSEAELLRPSAPKSQKGRGIIAAYDALKDYMPAVGLITTDDSPLSATEIVRNFYKKINGPIFVRPCPEIPNHGGKVGGFESEKFDTLDGAMMRVTEAHNKFVADGLNADIVLMPFVHSEMSCVIAPKRFAIFGKGHNGVTAGTSNTVMIPVAQQCDFTDRVNSISNMSEDMYEMEFVVHKNSWHTSYLQRYDAKFVQIRRSGEHIKVGKKPREDAKRGFVPNGTTIVQKVFVVADLDNVGELESMENSDGLLVIQPGGSFLSHCAAHCRTKSMAFVIDENCENWIGRKITDLGGGWITDADDAQVVESAGLETFRADFVKGFNEPFYKDNVKLSVFFHDFVGENLNAELGGYLAGRYAKWLAHAAVVLCIGESRHISAVMVGDKIREQVLDAILSLTGGSDKYQSRNAIYQKLFHWHLSNADAIAILQGAVNVFSLPWQSSYGGAKWRNCAELALRIYQAIEEGNITAAVNAANMLENSVHNGGRLYNKVAGWLESMDAGTTPCDIESGMYASNYDGKDILHSASMALYPQYCEDKHKGDYAQFIALKDITYVSPQVLEEEAAKNTTILDAQTIFENVENSN